MFNNSISQKYQGAFNNLQKMFPMLEALDQITDNFNIEVKNAPMKMLNDLSGLKDNIDVWVNQDQDSINMLADQLIIEELLERSSQRDKLVVELAKFDDLKYVDVEAIRVIYEHAIPSFSEPFSEGIIQQLNPQFREIITKFKLEDS